MRSETLEEVELTGVRPSLPAVRTFTRGNTGVEEVYVDTDNGPVCVAVQGDRSRPPILTYHDLGLNCEYRVKTRVFVVFVPAVPGGFPRARFLSAEYISRANVKRHSAARRLPPVDYNPRGGLYPRPGRTRWSGLKFDRRPRREIRSRELPIRLWRNDRSRGHRGLLRGQRPENGLNENARFDF